MSRRTVPGAQPKKQAKMPTAITAAAYFAEADLVVRRNELLGILTWWQKKQRDNRWYRRAWRWLMGRAIVSRDPLRLAQAKAAAEATEVAAQESASSK